MNPRRVMVIARRSLVQFRHDRRTLGFVMGMPLLMMLIFGYTFGGEVKNVSLIVVQEDDGAPVNGTEVEVNLGAALVDELKLNEAFDLSRSSDLEEARRKVSDGEAWGILWLPPDLSAKAMTALATNSTPVGVLELSLDGTNPNIEAAIRKGVQEAVIDIINDARQAQGLPPLEFADMITVEYVYGSDDLEFIDYFAPGVMGFAIMMVGTMLTILLFVQERTGGTLERLLTSPATEGEVVTGYALAFALLGLAQSIVILTTALLVFGVQVTGSLVLMLVVVVILAVGHQGLGILLSAGARNELQAVQFVPLVLFPSILLSGLFWPVESIPGVLQPLARVVPLTHGIEALRSVALRGWGIVEIWRQLAFLFGFAALTLGGSVAQLSRRD